MRPAPLHRCCYLPWTLIATHHAAIVRSDEAGAGSVALPSIFIGIYRLHRRSRRRPSTQKRCGTAATGVATVLLGRLQ